MYIKTLGDLFNSEGKILGLVTLVTLEKILRFWSDQPLPWSRLPLKILPLSLHWSSRIFEVKKLFPLKVLGYPQPWKSSIFSKNFALDLVNPWISSTRHLELQGYSCPLYYLCIYWSKICFLFSSAMHLIMTWECKTRTQFIIISGRKSLCFVDPRLLSQLSIVIDTRKTG